MCGLAAGLGASAPCPCVACSRPASSPDNAGGATAAWACWGRKELRALSVSLPISDRFVRCGFGHFGHLPTADPPPGTAQPASRGFPYPVQGFSGAKRIGSFSDTFPSLSVSRFKRRVTAASVTTEPPSPGAAVMASLPPRLRAARRVIPLLSVPPAG